MLKPCVIYLVWKPCFPYTRNFRSGGSGLYENIPHLLGEVNTMTYSLPLWMFTVTEIWTTEGYRIWVNLEF